MTVDDTGRVLAVTEGFTGSTSDKTIICNDGAVEQIRYDKHMEKPCVVFNADGTTRTLKGCYLLVDNGYHRVSTCNVRVNTALLLKKKNICVLQKAQGVTMGSAA